MSKYPKNPEKLLQELAEIEGFNSALELVEHYITDSVVPAICIHCHATYDLEPDGGNGAQCTECDAPNAIWGAIELMEMGGLD